MCDRCGVWEEVCVTDVGCGKRCERDVACGRRVCTCVCVRGGLGRERCVLGYEQV